MSSNPETSQSSKSSTSSSSNSIDHKKLEEFMMKAVGDMASSLGAMMIVLGDRLGLYKAMAKSGPITSKELPAQTNTAERYIREWLASQAAAGYVNYNPIEKSSFFHPKKQWCLQMKIALLSFWALIKCFVQYLKMKINLLKYSKVEKGFAGVSIIMTFLKEQQNFSNQTI